MEDEFDILNMSDLGPDDPVKNIFFDHEGNRHNMFIPNFVPITLPTIDTNLVSDNLLSPISRSLRSLADAKTKAAELDAQSRIDQANIRTRLEKESLKDYYDFILGETLGPNIFHGLTGSVQGGTDFFENFNRRLDSMKDNYINQYRRYKEAGANEEQAELLVKADIEKQKLLNPVEADLAIEQQRLNIVSQLEKENRQRELENMRSEAAIEAKNRENLANTMNVLQERPHIETVKELDIKTREANIQSTLLRDQATRETIKLTRERINSEIASRNLIPAQTTKVLDAAKSEMSEFLRIAVDLYLARNKDKPSLRIRLKNKVDFMKANSNLTSSIRSLRKLNLTNEQKLLLDTFEQLKVLSSTDDKLRTFESAFDKPDQYVDRARILNNISRQVTGNNLEDFIKIVETGELDQEIQTRGEIDSSRNSLQDLGL